MNISVCWGPARSHSCQLAASLWDPAVLLQLGGCSGQDYLMEVRSSFANGRRRKFLPQDQNMFSQPNLLTQLLWKREKLNVTSLHMHTIAHAAACVLGHLLREEHVRAEAWKQRVPELVPHSSTLGLITAFHKTVWPGPTVDLTRSQWFHWTTEICLKPRMCTSSFQTVERDQILLCRTYNLMLRAHRSVGITSHLWIKWSVMWTNQNPHRPFSLIQALQFQLQDQVNIFIIFLGYICKMGAGFRDVWEGSVSP